MKLILKLIVGIIVGIVVGYIYFLTGGEGAIGAVFEFLSRLLITLQSIFGSFIFFMIPLIILFFIATGISDIGKGSGKIVGATVGAAYMSTILAGTLAYIVAISIIPAITRGGDLAEEADGLQPFFVIEVEPIMGIMTALVLAFSVGIVMTILETNILKQFFNEGKRVVEFLIEKVVITILPFYIAGVFAELGSQGTVFKTISVFGLVLVIAILLHWIWLIILYTISGLLVGDNPFSMIKQMLPAYFTAIGTMSSAATIPVTLKQVKSFGVRNHIADFVVPLCATIHLSGSVITITTATIAVMTVLPEYVLPGPLEMIGTILLLGIVMVAAPGVPGGAIVAASGILVTNLGFTEAAVAVMMALYLAQDSFGTATNITGDGALSGIIDWFESKLSKDSSNTETINVKYK